MNANQQMFKKELDKPSRTLTQCHQKKKDFFNKIDSKYKTKE